MIDYSEFLKSLSSKRNHPDDVFTALYQLVKNFIEIKLFTLTTFDIPNAQAQRIFSNMPKEYPISGTKPIEKSDWTEIVLDKHDYFVANNIGDLTKVISDYSLIEKLGCQSVVNLPVVVDGTLLGTVNCLHEENYFTSEKIKDLEQIKLPAVACFLLNKLTNNTMDSL